MQEGTIQAQVQKAIDNPRFKRTRGVLFWLLVLVYVPFCTALLAVKWLVLPEIDRYRPEIQQFLQNQTGSPIEIGEIQASWRGFNFASVARQPQPTSYRIRREKVRSMLSRLAR